MEIHPTQLFRGLASEEGRFIARWEETTATEKIEHDFH
jgi:hypothetical protein